MSQPGPSGAVTAVDAPGGLALVGGAWTYLDSVRRDPLQRWFAEAVGGRESLQLRWSAAQGRHAVASRRLARGELLMVAPAVATVPHDGDSWATAAVARIGGAEAAGLDAAVLALARAVCVAGRQREMGSLLSHRDGLEVAALRAWREAAAALRAALAAEAKEAAAAAVERAGGASSESEAASEEELVELLLRVKNNAHRLLDEQTCAAGVGLAAAVASAEPGLLPLAGTCTTSLARRRSQRGSHPPRPQDAA